MIESGSHTPGVDPAAFRLPPHTALRIELPEHDLRPFAGDYHVLDSEYPYAGNAVSWLLPAWPSIRVILADRPIALTIGRRTYDPLPTASLYGTTSRAMRMTTHGGVTIGISLKPLGWARLFATRADLHRDRVVPLAEVMAPALANELVTRLAVSDRGAGVKPILDDFLATHLGAPHPDEPLITQLAALIADEDTRDLGTACERVGINMVALRRLSTRYFGFPPKTLLMRTRFLRSLLRLMAAEDGADLTHIAPTYYDASHFIRDANRFLGTTPRRFLKEYKGSYPHAVLRARALVGEADRRGR